MRREVSQSLDALRGGRRGGGERERGLAFAALQLVELEPRVECRSRPDVVPVEDGLPYAVAQVGAVAAAGVLVLEFDGPWPAVSVRKKRVLEHMAVLKLNPRHTTSHINLGVMFARQNRLGDAIARFEDALKLEPTNQTAYRYLNDVKARQNRKP